MNGYLQILQQPWYEHHADTRWWKLWILIGLLLAAGLTLRAANGERHPVALAALVPLGVLSVMWWLMFIQSAVRQNSPLHAQLVPHLRRRLMRVTAALWLAGSLCAGLAAALAGHFGGGFLGAALFMLVIAARERFPRLVKIPAAAFIAYSFIPHSLDYPFRLLARVDDPAVCAIGFILMALIGAAVLPALFLAGGDRHRRWQVQFACRLEALRTGVIRESAAPGWRHWNLLRRSGYVSSLKHACAKGAPSARMQMYVLGPDAFWTSYLSAPVLTLVLAIAASGALGQSAFLAGFMPVYSAFVVMIPLGSYVRNVGAAIFRTSTEQGLQRLVPGAVPALTFNRVFARRLLGGFFKLWLACAVSSVCTGRIFGGAEVSWIYLISLTGLTLPLSVLLLRNYAAMAVPGGSFVTAVTASGMLVLLVGMSAFRMLVWTQIWTAIGIASVLLTAVLLARGRRRMLAMPAAFPARRMA